MSTGNLNNERHWTLTERNVFRFVLIYFLLQALPISIGYWARLFSINWFSPDYQDIFNLTRFYPSFFGEDSFVNWLVIAIIALAGAFALKKRFEKFTDADYDRLYYWLRVIVRYRLAIAVIGYGIIKVWPLQAPFPSISNLNTSYGDFNNWKVFSLSLGVVPSYETFLGLFEVLAGLLLFFRRTASIGAIIILVFTGNVFISNLAYEGGEYVYSFYILSFALFVLAQDALRIHRLIALEQPTSPVHFKPHFAGKLATVRVVSKILVVLLFVVIYGFKASDGYKNDPYQFPKSTGLSNSAGFYNVREFRLNQKEHPYSATDPVRWRDVVFEKWATISIRSNRPVVLQTSNYERTSRNDDERDYELAGSGGRHYYSYTVDTVQHLLHLQNKNRHYAGEKLTLNYSWLSDSTLALSGRATNQDSIYVVLDRVSKKYLLLQDRREKIKL
ncbi:DoxX family protein [Mucilaginibacter roseus]|uniref:DoxX family protein n=1 Tax=Mucilaginibacter roseus TaxID=1528868 RepID=A0ABS8U870_9SPHI|nr:DoxX family protein [Mucilaginibacter roseus]MCD8742149.1 DoxX family protein [Mucilaginibacter roseus]